MDAVREKNPDDAALACSDLVGDSSEVLVNTEAVAPSPHLVPLGTSESDLKLERSPPEDHDRCNSNQSVFPDEDICSTVNNVPSTQYEKQAIKAEQKCLPGDLNMCKESQDLIEFGELTSVPNQLFWPNSDKLCWLDSLLTALVNCKSLRKCQPQDEPKKSTVWRLMRGYEDICAAVRAQQQTSADGIVRVPNHVLQRANEDLQSLRMSMFKVLEPKLHCKLGQQETPVFAMPLLLEMDSWAERVFKSSFYWDFQCTACKAATKVRVTKTLPTLTNLVPGWRPLDAVHIAPCNVCRKKNQLRTIVLEKVPPVFALHFVEGLPDGDAGLYTFEFKGQRHSITSVIQYDDQLKHFVTWTRNSDGSWLEYDDLKHPHCTTHPTLGVPAKEMHVVFWEVEAGNESRACSPSSTLPDSSPPEAQKIPSSNDGGSRADDPVSGSPDESLPTPHDDTDIVHALLVSDSSLVTDTTAEGESLIGADTLLDTFEGLSHDDIVTLTLVEVNADSEEQQSQDPSRNEVVNAAPDSSSSFSFVAATVEVESVPPSSPEPESVDSASSDPPYVPSGRKGRANTRGKTAAKQKGKKASKTEAPSPSTKVAAPPRPSKVLITPPGCPTPKNTVLPVGRTQQASPESSTNTPPLPANHTSSSVSVTEARWSYLLSKHPQNQAQKACAAPRSATPPAHSTPVPVKRPPPPPPPFYPKPQLKTEQNKGLPVKAAEMYGAFGAPKRPTCPANPTATPAPSPHPLGGNLESSSLNKRPSKLPAGLTDTDALRLKLLKKLKAKKKKLAKLNMLLGDPRAAASLRPDSTDLGSPSTVTSSTYDGSAYDDILSDLLSPATTASNLSPDSTEFLERLATGNDTAGPVTHTNGAANAPRAENFLEEFLLQAEAQRPTEMESEALSALELFI